MMDIYQGFIEDYNNPNITTCDVMRYNQLNSKQYSKLKKEAITNGDIPPVRHMNTTNAKFYTCINGDYVVRKTTGKHTLVVGKFADEATAQMIVEECKKVNWEIDRIKDLIDFHRIKPKNYSLINGWFVIQKSIDGVNQYFCRVRKEAEAIKLVDELEKHGWDKDVVLKFKRGDHLEC